jgi:hypothetical protein
MLTTTMLPGATGDPEQLTRLLAQLKTINKRLYLQCESIAHHSKLFNVHDDFSPPKPPPFLVELPLILLQPIVALLQPIVA